MRKDATVATPAWLDSPNLHNIEVIGETKWCRKSPSCTYRLSSKTIWRAFGGWWTESVLSTGSSWNWGHLRFSVHDAELECKFQWGGSLISNVGLYDAVNTAFLIRSANVTEHLISCFNGDSRSLFKTDTFWTSNGYQVYWALRHFRLWSSNKPSHSRREHGGADSLWHRCRSGIPTTSCPLPHIRLSNEQCWGARTFMLLPSSRQRLSHSWTSLFPLTAQQVAVRNVEGTTRLPRFGNPDIRVSVVLRKLHFPISISYIPLAEQLQSRRNFTGEP